MEQNQCDERIYCTENELFIAMHEAFVSGSSCTFDLKDQEIASVYKEFAKSSQLYRQFVNKSNSISDTKYSKVNKCPVCSANEGEFSSTLKSLMLSDGRFLVNCVNCGVITF